MIHELEYGLTYHLVSVLALIIVLAPRVGFFPADAEDISTEHTQPVP